MRTCFIIILSLIINLSYGQQSTNLIGDYLGQTPPTDTATIFANGIISTSGSSEYICSVHPNMNVIVWTSGKDSGKTINQKNKRLFYMERVDSIWSKPKQLILSDTYSEEEGIFSLDGTKLYYSSNRPNQDDTDLWYVEVSEEGWKQPQKVDIPDMPEGRQIYITSTNNGTLFFSSRKTTGDDKRYRIYCSKKVNGKYCKPEYIMDGAHTFVHPEGKYFLTEYFDSEGDGIVDIGVCFKVEDNSFSKPVNLGEKINTKFIETCATLSPDLKYIFFSRSEEPNKKSNIYWVSSSIIDNVENDFRENERLKH